MTKMTGVTGINEMTKMTEVTGMIRMTGMIIIARVNAIIVKTRI